MHAASEASTAVAALDRGGAYAELDGVDLALVSGRDARAWLHDLVTTDVESLPRGRARPSLLLTPTGRIRAAFHVLGRGDHELLLAQPGDQPDRIADLLAPYVLSSDVEIAPTTLRLLAVPGGAEAPTGPFGVWRPSVLGDGFDVLVDAESEGTLGDARARLAAAGLVPSTFRAVEERRIRRGEPRFPPDLDAASLPAEAGWDADPVTDRTKGCFLGQEAVAKVANLGHPTRVVLPVEADDALTSGDDVRADGAAVGSVTSADGPLGLVRVRWDAPRTGLSTASGVAIRVR